MTAAAAAPAPRVSVVIRSYNRIPALCRLIDTLLAQRHDSFEIVVVDQSTPADVPAEAAARLAQLEADPRLRVLRHPPLGGARARNVGVQAARGAIVVLVDDDDFPVGDGFLAALERPFADPLVLGVTCRHLWGSDTDTPSALYRFLARRRCMRLSPLLLLPLTWARLDEPVAPVDALHGTGSALRRALYDRFGGWDTDTPIEDEASFCLRVRAGKAPGEHFRFDPSAVLRRDLDVGGGLAKRHLTPAGFYKKLLTFVHKILGRHARARVIALYPLYVAAGYLWTVEWLWGDSRVYDTTAKRALAALGFLVTLPYHAAKMLAVPLGRPGDAAAAAPGSVAHLDPAKR